MLYEGLDFETDLVSCYSHIRKVMAGQYHTENFGPIAVPNENTSIMEPEELLQQKPRVDKMEKLIKEGYNRVKTKIKDLRAGYKQAIDKGTRSGSGRFVHDFYDQLHEICGGVIREHFGASTH